MEGHEVFSSKDEMLNYYKDIYGERVTLIRLVKIVFFKFTPSTGENRPEQCCLTRQKFIRMAVQEAILVTLHVLM
jgi:hypothetical protein